MKYENIENKKYPTDEEAKLMGYMSRQADCSFKQMMEFMKMNTDEVNCIVKSLRDKRFIEIVSPPVPSSFNRLQWAIMKTLFVLKELEEKDLVTLKIRPVFEDMSKIEAYAKEQMWNEVGTDEMLGILKDLLEAGHVEITGVGISLVDLFQK